MKESYLDYNYEFYDPNSDWIFITPSIEPGERGITPQECGRLIINGSHHTERGPLESFQITFCERAPQGRIRLDGKEYALYRDNECMFLDCRRGYRIETFGAQVATFIHFYGPGVGYYMNLFDRFNGGDPVLHQFSQTVRDNLLKLIQLYKRPNNCQSDIMAEMLITEMMVDMIRRAMPEEHHSYSDYVQATIDYISAHISESLTLDGIAEKIHVSKFYLSHIFKRETGVTPINYLQQLRISRAKELLRTTNLSQEAICGKVGLYNCSYLSKLFRAYEGMTPNQYRENWK